MEQQSAWKALFAQTHPIGVDLDEAVRAVEGLGEVDPSVKLEPAVQSRTDEFLMDPGDFLKTNSADPRVPQWTKLAKALGVTALSDSSPAPNSVPTPASSATASQPASSSSSAPSAQVRRPMSASALADATVGGGNPSVVSIGTGRGGGAAPGAGGGGGVVVRGGGDGNGDPPPKRDKKDRKERDKKERKGRDRDEEEDEDDEQDNRRQRRDHNPPDPSPRPKPLIDVNDRTIPAITQEILAYDSYKSWSAMIIEAFRLIRTGTSAQQSQKRAEIPHARRLIGSMKASTTRIEVQAGFHLERLLEALESGLDQRRPGYFQAMYVTGGDYTD